MAVQEDLEVRRTEQHFFLSAGETQNSLVRLFVGCVGWGEEAFIYVCLNKDFPYGFQRRSELLAKIRIHDPSAPDH